MNKKDRIAVVLNILYIIFLFILEENRVIIDVQGLMLSLPLIGYWVYRFISGDISFLPSIFKK